MGYMIDGTQAEYVRTPFADNSLYAFPDNLTEEAGVLLSDALPTAHEIGVQYGGVQPGDTVAIVGAGPVGMSALLTSLLYSPWQAIMIDLDENRLRMAKGMGATDTVNSGAENAVEKVMKLTDGRGVDCAIEAVGSGPTWDICQGIVKDGGHLANVGVHGKPVKFDIEKLWIKNLTITTGLVNANTTDMLMKTCCSGKLQAEKLVTHRFDFNDIEKAYDVFKHAADEKAMKVMIDL
ncbi:MAG: zinc-binding dehydrogenase [Bifidobacterium sp.]|nr:zinc-binding dehydrogenase [Bifidobacterium sp.]